MYLLLAIAAGLLLTPSSAFTATLMQFAIEGRQHEAFLSASPADSVLLVGWWIYPSLLATLLLLAVYVLCVSKSLRFSLNRLHLIRQRIAG